MKKFASLLMAVALLATMLTVFALPASAAKTYSLTFEINWPEGKAGNCRKMPSYTGNNPMKIDLPIPSYVEGYNFEGWCEKSDLSDTPIKAIPANSTGDKTFYGKWSKSYKITWHKNGGTLTRQGALISSLQGDTYEEYYTPGVETELYYGAEKPGFGFGGWYNNPDFTGKPVTKIGANETGDKDFYARFCTRVKVPEAEEGLSYTGELLTGVSTGEGYTIKGNTEKYPGTYNAVATLVDGYIWADGTFEDKTIPWSIGKGTITASYLERTINDDNTISTEEKTCDCPEVVTPRDTVWGVDGEPTWYVVDESVELENRPVVKGDVHVILKNETTLTVNKGITVEDNNTLRFYAQTDDENTMGKLSIAATEENGSAGVTAIGGRNGKNGADGQIGLPGEKGENGGNGGNIYFYGGRFSLKSSGIHCIGGGNGGNGGDGGDGYNDGRHICPGGIAGNGGNGGKSCKVYVSGGKLSLESDSTACIGVGKGGIGGEKGTYPQNGSADSENGQPGSFTTKNDLIVYGTPVIKAGASAESATPLNDVSEYTNQPYLSVQYESVSTLGSVLSQGNVWIIVVIAVVVLGGIAALVIVKKKPALAGGTDNTDEE